MIKPADCKETKLLLSKTIYSLQFTITVTTDEQK